MYFRESENVGGYDEEPGVRDPGYGLAPAIVAGGGIVITVGAVIEALLFVASAIAAAYLLIKAYEKAKSLGIGVTWAGEQLMNAMQRVVQGARRVIQELRRLLDQAGRQRLPPNCQPLLRLLTERLARIEQAVADYVAEPTNIHSPASPAKVRLLRVLEDSLYAIRPMMEMLRQCLRS